MNPELSLLTRAALFSGLGIILVSLLLLASTVYLRVRQVWRARRAEQRSQHWHQWFDCRSPEGTPKDPEPWNSQWDLELFLSVWIQRFRQNKDRETLYTVATQYNLQKRLIDLCPRASFQNKLLYLTVLGFLGETDAWNLFRSELQDPNTVATLVAARAMLRTRVDRALPEIFTQIKQEDLPQSRLMNLLSGINPGLMTDPLLQELNDSSDQEKRKLIPFLECAEPEPARSWVRDQICRTEDPETLSACINVLGSVGKPEDAALIRPFVDHSQWFVRVRTLHTLAILDPDGERQFMEKLSDPNWWVRRAASLGLVQLHQHQPERLHLLLGNIDDKYGRQELRDIMDEQGLQ